MLDYHFKEAGTNKWWYDLSPVLELGPTYHHKMRMQRISLRSFKPVLVFRLLLHMLTISASLYSCAQSCRYCAPSVLLLQDEQHAEPGFLCYEQTSTTQERSQRKAPSSWLCTQTQPQTGGRQGAKFGISVSTPDPAYRPLHQPCNHPSQNSCLLQRRLQGLSFVHDD